MREKAIDVVVDGNLIGIDLPKDKGAAKWRRGHNTQSSSVFFDMKLQELESSHRCHWVSTSGKENQEGINALLEFGNSFLKFLFPSRCCSSFPSTRFQMADSGIGVFLIFMR